MRFTAFTAIAAAALLVIAPLVTGVPATPSSDRPPMSASQRDQRRTAFLDESWAPVAEQYPEAIRPDVAIGRVVDDRGRLTAIATCLQDAGLIAEVTGGRLAYSNQAGQTPVDVAVIYYSCAAAYPTIQRVTADLDSRQLGALWDYYTGLLKPCLAASGFPTWIPPTRAEFIAPDGHHTWNPYFPLRGARLSPEELVPLEQRCRAVPTWLDLRTV